jgi:hypothetical protein
MEEDSNDGVASITDGLESNLLDATPTPSETNLHKRKNSVGSAEINTSHKKAVQTPKAGPSSAPSETPAGPSISKTTVSPSGPNVKFIPEHLEAVFRNIRSIDDKIVRLELHSEFLLRYRESPWRPRLL